MREIACEQCGAMYRITGHHSPMRDKDSINCRECGNELLRWNGSTWYTAEYIGHPADDSVDEDDEPYVDECQACGQTAELYPVEDGDTIRMVCGECSLLFH